ncbi:MAG: exodeoxyribonuclease-3 [Candidatus Woesearchaeota archaeon]|jgi:exodeoxyribonuclease-3
MKIISWNVNGIRAAIKKGFVDFVTEHQPDVLCIQETKAQPEQVDIHLEGYESHVWNSAERKGYSGTLIFSKTKPLSVTKGIGHEVDNEGRVITVEFEKFYVVTVYTPNSKDDLSRIPLRYNEWDPLFLKHCKELEKKKPVVFCGDLNVAHEEIDLKNFKPNRGKHGFTNEERERFSDFISAGFIDTFRHMYPEEQKYSWWSMMGGARSRNVGWRIDYVCVSSVLMPKVKESFILNEVLGSDHCPVGIILD